MLQTEKTGSLKILGKIPTGIEVARTAISEEMFDKLELGDGFLQSLPSFIPLLIIDQNQIYENKQTKCTLSKVRIIRIPYVPFQPFVFL